MGAQFNGLFGRARALMHLDKHYNAIRDFGECLSLNHQHQLTNYYLGMCLIKIGKHEVEKMKQAHKYLLIAQNGSLKQPRFEKAVEKAIKILKKLQPKVEISNGTKSSEKNEDVEMKSNDQKSEEIANKASNSIVKEPENKKAKISKPSIRDSWYQSDTNISFILYAKNMSKEDISIEYAAQRVVIKLNLKDGSTYTRNINLCGKISPDKCSYAMNKYKITLTLVKETGGKWDELEPAMDDGKEHSMISAPWNTKRNWDKVDKYAEEELAKEKPEGDEALQSLFSKIYKDADDDQKRAMMKSFQTSGGTVLSTNWNDVKDKDYEGKDKVLPTGQNVEKWEY